MTDDDWDEDLESEEETENTFPCPYCGHEIFDDAVQCPHCRNYIEDDARSAWRSSAWMLIVKITAIFLLLAILMQVVLLLWYR